MQKNEAILLVESTDGTPVGATINPDTKSYFLPKRCAHLSCMQEERDNFFIHYDPTNLLFESNPQIEPNCIVCNLPLLRKC